MKAFILFLILAGEPAMLKDYDTSSECAAALASAKLTLSSSDAAQHRCASRADFEFGVELAERRAFLEWRSPNGD